MSAYCTHCGATAGWGRELGHRSDCPELERERAFTLPGDMKRYQHLLAAFAELQTAALKVCDEMDRSHDSKPPPQKYGAPFGAIAELRVLLNKQLGMSR